MYARRYDRTTHGASIKFCRLRAMDTREVETIEASRLENKSPKRRL
jgi:hypothetical protein